MTTLPGVTEIQDVVVRLRENVQQAIVGKDEAIRLAMIALLCRGHILVEDVPGIGKTTMAKALAASLGTTFRRIQFTPDLMPSDVLGVSFFNQKTGDFEFRPGPVFGQVVLGDEINRATPRTQAALLEAMQERQVTIDGATMPLPNPFIVIATQNPIEMEGTFPLPEAQLHRFMVRIKLGYPSPEEEADIYQRFDRDVEGPSLDAVVELEVLHRMQDVPSTVLVDEAVRGYIVSIIQASRGHAGLSLGASPRAGLALYRTSQALAAIEGRDFVTPDDVKALALPVLTHRMILSSSARLKGQTAEHIVSEILSDIPVPVEG